MTPRTGRPKADDPLSKIVTVRFTEGQYADVAAAVEASELAESAWIREAAIAVARHGIPTAKKKRRPARDTPEG